MNKELLEYFGGDEMAASVWSKKYCLRDIDENELESTPRDMNLRLAKEILRIEKNYPNPTPYHKILEMFNSGKFMFGGSPMSGIGNDLYKTSLSNCFAIGSPVDSYGGIMKTDEELVQLMKRRGGVGTDLSKIRPSDALCNNSKIDGMSGVELYMHRYSNSTREVSQKDRNGALMLSLSVDHVDADKFANAKSDRSSVTGANISLRVGNDFMKAVKNDEDYIQTYPVDLDITLHTAFIEALDNGDIEYNKAYHLKYDDCNEFDGCYAKRVKAKELFDMIVDRNWHDAEPGVLFWDTIVSESPSDQYPDVTTCTTNPCGEIGLPAKDSCRLGCLVLPKYVSNSKFKIEEFKEDVILAQRFMDDLVDLEIEKIDTILKKIESDPEDDNVKAREIELWSDIKKIASEYRRTGLGITGAGDMIVQCGFKYGSHEANLFYESIHKEMAIASYKSSIIMAEERGAFLKYDANYDFISSKSLFIKRILEAISNDSSDYIYKWANYGRRNVSNLTIAPTGSVSIVAQTTSGIEPLFSPFYLRRKKTNDPEKSVFVDEVGDMWEEFFVIHKGFKDWIYENYYDDKSYLEYALSDQSELTKLFEKSPYYGSTTNDIDYIGKVEMQGLAQKWIDHNISVTVNLPKDVTKQQISDIYMKAWECGCKGITIYRDGSRSGVLVSAETDNVNDDFVESRAYGRPDSIDCDISRFKASGEDWLAIIGKINGRPYEVFSVKASDVSGVSNDCVSGKITKVKYPDRKTIYVLSTNDGNCGCQNIISDIDYEKYSNYSRFLSSCLRHRMGVKYIVDQISKMGDEPVFGSWKSGLIVALKKYIKDGEESKEKCTECGSSSNLVYENGCLTCKDCGYSKCG